MENAQELVEEAPLLVNSKIGCFLHNLGDTLFNKVTIDLDLSEKQMGNPQDKFIIHQDCV